MRHHSKEVRSQKDQVTDVILVRALSPAGPALLAPAAQELFEANDSEPKVAGHAAVSLISCSAFMGTCRLSLIGWSSCDKRKRPQALAPALLFSGAQGACGSVSVTATPGIRTPEVSANHVQTKSDLGPTAMRFTSIKGCIPKS